MNEEVFELSKEERRRLRGEMLVLWMEGCFDLGAVMVVFEDGRRQAAVRYSYFEAPTGGPCRIPTRPLVTIWMVHGDPLMPREEPETSAAWLQRSTDVLFYTETNGERSPLWVSRHHAKEINPEDRYAPWFLLTPELPSGSDPRRSIEIKIELHPLDVDLDRGARA